MKEIKFQAWDKKSKKIRQVDSITFHNKNSVFDYDGSNLPKIVGVWGYDIIEQKEIILYREIKDIILRRYTGLKDKNGKEIYEGDIVKFKRIDDKECIGEISYVDRYGAFFVIYSGCSDNQLYYAFDGYEVIGNIYENHELLEEGEN